MKLFAEIIGRTIPNTPLMVFKVDVPFNLEDFQCHSAEYTRNWCKEILYAYTVGYHLTEKLILKNEKGKIIKTFRLNSLK